MKKILICLLVLLTICGCQQEDTSNAKLSKENTEVFFKYDGKEYTTNDCFQKLKAQYAASYFDALIAKKAIELDNIPIDEFKTQITDEYNMLVEEQGQEVVDEMYGPLDEILDVTIINNATYLYLNDYVKNNAEQYVETYPTSYVQYISSTNKSKMNTFVKNLKKNDFNTAFDKTKFKDNESIIETMLDTTNTGLPEEVNTALTSLNVGETSSLIEVVTEPTEEGGEKTTTYYVISLVSNDPLNDYKDEFCNYLLNMGIVTNATMLVREKHDIQMYDDDFDFTYKAFLKQYAPDEVESDTAE